MADRGPQALLSQVVELVRSKQPREALVQIDLGRRCFADCPEVIEAWHRIDRLVNGMQVQPAR